MPSCCSAVLIGVLVVSGAVAPVYADVKNGIAAYQRGDFASAVSAWRPLADAGDADAQYNLGQAYRLGRGVPLDPQAAETLFKKAANQGHDRARNAYGLTLFQNGRRAEAIPYIEEAAGNNFPQAQYVFATLLFNGDMIEKDWVRSYAMMTRAAAGNVAAAKAGLEQLDKYIPLDQRERGLKLAQVFENATDRENDSIATSLVVATKAPSTISPLLKQSAKSSSVPAAVSGRWRVQLGAFSNIAGASLLWSKLKSRVIAVGPYQSIIQPTGAVTRLQVGPMTSRADAERLCAALKASGDACLVIAP